MARVTNEIDEARSLRNPGVREARLKMLGCRHVASLTRYVEELRPEVEQLRLELDIGELVPYFDPLDGGIDAKCLFIIEAPGIGPVKSGYISRNNDDDTAENFFNLNSEDDVDLDRTLTASWNLVPWYLGDGKRIWHPNTSEKAAGLAHLQRLLSGPMRNVEVVVLSGKPAREQAVAIKKQFPGLAVLEMPHPSRTNLNTHRGFRDEIRNTLREVKYLLGC